jgi:carboxyl-terminal processing protease
MSAKTKKISFLLIILILILISYKIGYEQAWAQSFRIKKFTSEDFSTFLKVWSIINNNYVEESKIDKKKAMFEATRGLVRSLEDPYSEFLDEKQTSILNQDLSGSFGGVGMEIGIRKGVLTIIAPLEGTPAEKAGFRPGDQILKINGEDTLNMSLDEAVSKIRGKPGTEVVLTIFRQEWQEPKDFKITREIINIVTVKSKMIDSKIGYIKVNTFNENTSAEFKKAYQSLQKQGADRFIIDLRNNPGGYLHIVIEMSSLFLDKGSIVLREVQRNQNKKGKSEDIIYSQGPGNFSKKVVILINRGSASASEIFAGALRDNLKVKLIGEKSYGKGSVQKPFEIENKMLKLTIAYWLTPKGEKIEGNGLKPDIEVQDTLIESTSTDAVLDKAIEVIKTL